METKKAIIYDDTCPMCELYTSAFVNYGLLGKEGRVSFSELTENRACQIDFEKSKHEIPLIDLEGGDTIYGLDSLIYILNQRFPVIGKIMRIGFIYGFFKQLYHVVSYNRRVIAPSKKRIIKYDCSPNFHLKYRLVYIGFGFFMSFSLWFFSYSVFSLFPSFEIVLGVIILIMLTGLLFFRGKAIIEYLGQIATVLLIGGLIIIPTLIFPALNYFLMITALAVMCWQYFRRIKLMKLS